MSATVRQIRQQPGADEPRVSAPRERKQTFEWTIQSVFHPHLAMRPKHTRRCTSCGYHGPMRTWFGHFAAPWLFLLAVALVSVAPGLAVLLVPRVSEWVWFYANPLIVGSVLLALALVPVGAFLFKYARSYKCPHCGKVGENH